MPILQPNKEKLISVLKREVSRVNKKYSSPLEFFKEIQGTFDRVELMIIDSAIKNMPLHNLDKTLLLLHSDYVRMLHSIALTLKKQ